MDRKTKPRRGSPRVAAWVHTVLNSWVEMVPGELAYLLKGDVTWRFWSRKLDFVRPLRDFLAPSAWHTLDDLLRARPEIAPSVEKHDRLQADLEQAAAGAHDDLLGRSEFQEEVRKRLAEYRAGTADAGHPGGAVGEKGFASLVAQNVVNRVVELPDHYADHLFWREHGSRFLSMRTGPRFEVLDRRTKELAWSDGEFLELVREWRFQLVEEFDIPPSA